MQTNSRHQTSAEPYAPPNPRRALMWALSAALCGSVVPVGVYQWAGDSNPLLFNAVMVSAGAMVVTGYLLAARHDAWKMVRNICAAAIRERHTPRGKAALVVLCVGSVDYAAFVLAAQLINVAVAAVLYEVWVVSLVVLLAVKGGSSQRRLDRLTFGLVVVAAIGAGVVLASQADSLNLGGRWGLLGVPVALLAGVWGGALISETIIAAHNAHRDAGGTQREAMGTMVAGVGVILATGAVGSLILGLAMGGTLGWTAAAAAATLGALASVAGMSVRHAHMHSNSLGINAVLSSGAVFALVWLFLVDVPLQRVTLFVAGAALVLAANLVIQVRSAAMHRAEAINTTRI